MILEYVTVWSAGILCISSWSRTKKEFVPFVTLFISPCDKLHHSFPNAAEHFFCISVLFANVLYFVIDSPVIGWMTGEQKFSIGVIFESFGIDHAGLMTGE